MDKTPPAIRQALYRTKLKQAYGQLHSNNKALVTLMNTLAAIHPLAAKEPITQVIPDGKRGSMEVTIIGRKLIIRWQGKEFVLRQK